MFGVRVACTGSSASSDKSCTKAVVKWSYKNKECRGVSKLAIFPTLLVIVYTLPTAGALFARPTVETTSPGTRMSTFCADPVCSPLIRDNWDVVWLEL